MAVSSLLQTQFNSYQSASEFNLTRIKLAQAERLKKEYAAIEDKYDGSAQAEYEEKLQKAVDNKFTMSESLNAVQSALKKMDDLRNKLLEMRAAAKTGSAEAFDYAYSTLTTMAGSSSLDSDSLIANNRSNDMTWPEKTTIVSAGSYQISYTNRFLGSDYAIKLDNSGDVLRPNQNETSLQGPSGDINFSDISNVSINGDAITFDANGTSYSGTLARGGGGLLNSWAYGNFTGADAEAQKAQAMADVDAALEHLRGGETMWGIAEAQLQGGYDRMSLLQEEAQTTFETKSNEIIDAKTAELKAAKARFDLSTNTLALSNGQAGNFIYQMFISSPTYESKDLFSLTSGVG